MIGRVIIRRFKKFQDVTFDLPGHIVLAGPNNTGKTTMLQAVAAWSLAFDTWKTHNQHAFEPQTVQVGGISAKVMKAGKPVRIRESITVGHKTTTARGR
ncbi:MAG: AAA family ATPase [Acidobacteria bacterium]|nr:AAA family ATPase [Acidobacteriota bacterium]